MIQNVGSIHIDPGSVERALASAALFARANRSDSYGLINPHNAIDAYARHTDGLALQHLAQTSQWTPPPEMLADRQLAVAAGRADALPVGAGAAIRDLEYVRAQVLEELYPAHNSELLFTADNEVPLGATSHIMERYVTSGEAQIHRGGNSVPLASAGKIEERFGICYVVCGIRTNFFHQLSVDYAGLRQFQIESAAAIRLVRERINRLNWGGDVGTQIKGALNYPHLAKVQIATSFTTSSTGAQVVAALNTLVGTPRIVSKQVMFPDRLVVSETIHQFLTQTQYAAGQDTTIAEFFLKGQVGKPGGIKQIEAAYELEENSEEMLRAGAPADYHGMLAFRSDIGATRRVVVQEPTWLPMWQSGPFDSQHVVFAAAGGIVMPDVGANILGYVAG